MSYSVLGYYPLLELILNSNREAIDLRTRAEMLRAIASAPLGGTQNQKLPFPFSKKMGGAGGSREKLKGSRFTQERSD